MKAAFLCLHIDHSSKQQLYNGVFSFLYFQGISRTAALLLAMIAVVMRQIELLLVVL